MYARIGILIVASTKHQPSPLYLSKYNIPSFNNIFISYVSLLKNI